MQTLNEFRLAVADRLVNKREAGDAFGTIAGCILAHYSSIPAEALGYSKSEGYKDNGTSAMTRKELADATWQDAIDFGWITPTGHIQINDAHANIDSIYYQVWCRRHHFHWQINDDGSYALMTSRTNPYASNSYTLWRGEAADHPYLKHLTGWLEDLKLEKTGSWSYQVSKLANLVLLAYENRPDYHARSWRLLPIEEAMTPPDPNARMSDGPEPYDGPNLLDD